MSAGVETGKYNEPFPSRLRALMAERSVTQQTLAEYVGIKRQTVAAYASGDAEPTLPRMVAIADYFGVTIDYLVGRAAATTPDNEEIHKALGLSDRTISYLRKAYQTENSFARLVHEPIRSAINSLVATDYGIEVLSGIYDYLHADFEHPYIMTGRSRIKGEELQFEKIDITNIYFGTDANISSVEVHIETLSESVLSRVTNSIRSLREAQHVNPEDPE